MNRPLQQFLVLWLSQLMSLEFCLALLTVLLKKLAWYIFISSVADHTIIGPCRCFAPVGKLSIILSTTSSGGLKSNLSKSCGPSVSLIVVSGSISECLSTLRAGQCQRGSIGGA